MQAQVDAFDDIYNTQRPHQGLPGRITPQQAWEATEKAEPNRPKPQQPLYVKAAAKQFQPPPAPEDLPAGTIVRRLTSNGTFMLGGVHYMVGGQYGFQHVNVITENNTITVADLDGVILIEHTRPAPGTT